MKHSLKQLGLLGLLALLSAGVPFGHAQDDDGVDTAQDVAGTIEDVAGLAGDIEDWTQMGVDDILDKIDSGDFTDSDFLAGLGNERLNEIAGKAGKWAKPVEYVLKAIKAGLITYELHDALKRQDESDFVEAFDDLVKDAVTGLASAGGAAAGASAGGAAGAAGGAWLGGVGAFVLGPVGSVVGGGLGGWGAGAAAGWAYDRWGSDVVKNEIATWLYDELEDLYHPNADTPTNSGTPTDSSGTSGGGHPGGSTPAPGGGGHPGGSTPGNGLPPPGGIEPGNPSSRPPSLQPFR